MRQSTDAEGVKGPIAVGVRGVRRPSLGKAGQESGKPH